MNSKDTLLRLLEEADLIADSDLEEDVDISLDDCVSDLNKEYALMSDAIKSTQYDPPELATTTKKAQNEDTSTNTSTKDAQRPFFVSKLRAFSSVSVVLLLVGLFTMSRVMPRFFTPNLDVFREPTTVYNRALDKQTFKAVGSLASRIDKLEDNFVSLESKTNALATQLEILNSAVRKISNRLDSPDFELFITENVLSKHVPVLKKGKILTVDPHFEDYLTSIITKYVTGSSTKDETYTPDLYKMTSKLIEDNLKLVSMTNSSFYKQLKAQILSDLDYGVIISQIAPALSENSEPQKLAIDSTTRGIVASMVQSILATSTQSQSAHNYNYANYENGARIDADYVCSFSSFNVSELWETQQKYKKSFKSRIGFGGQDPTRYKDEKLVQNTYQTILDTSSLPRDNFPNIQGIPTGIKTFAVKLSQPVFLSEILVSYPRYIDNPSSVYCAPEKISVWIQLANPVNDLPKLRDYLMKATQSQYENRYVINIEKLQGTSNKIPMKRIKTVEEEQYEKFYESNFKLFENGFVKIGSMNYSMNPLDPIDQSFSLINQEFKSLHLRVSAIFFSIESNHGKDKFSTNLFKVKVHGVSEFDLFCMKQLLGGEEDLEKLEKMFNKKYVASEPASTSLQTDKPDSTPHETVAVSDEVDYF